VSNSNLSFYLSLQTEILTFVPFVHGGKTGG
jgi:hypothetical protein